MVERHALTLLADGRCRSRTAIRLGSQDLRSRSATSRSRFEEWRIRRQRLDPDLREFKARGGKLLLYHGWNDPLISAGNTINYYDSVVRENGSRTGRLDATVHRARDGPLPGRARPGSGQLVGPLERWRERGKAPDRIEAARVAGNRIEMTRPLCPYPEIAKYKGVGSTNDAENFVCSAK